MKKRELEDQIIFLLYFENMLKDKIEQKKKKKKKYVEYNLLLTKVETMFDFYEDLISY
tara:strand:- start:374 stop:547 length:174 start_codon:yes stop_codon:yes gene_type:complete